MTFTGAPNEVKLMTLDPGHFHAALVQKAGFLAEQDNYLGASVMFRQARKVTSQYSQYFDDAERRSVEQGDSYAIDAASIEIVGKRESSGVRCWAASALALSSS